MALYVHAGFAPFLSATKWQQDFTVNLYFKFRVFFLTNHNVCDEKAVYGKPKSNMQKQKKIYIFNTHIFFFVIGCFDLKFCMNYLASNNIIVVL